MHFASKPSKPSKFLVWAPLPKIVLSLLERLKMAFTLFLLVTQKNLYLIVKKSLFSLA